MDSTHLRESGVQRLCGEGFFLQVDSPIGEQFLCARMACPVHFARGLIQINSLIMGTARIFLMSKRQHVQVPLDAKLVAKIGLSVAIASCERRMMPLPEPIPAIMV